MTRDMQRQDKAIEAIVRDEFISKAANDFVGIVLDILTEVPTAVSGNLPKALIQVSAKSGQKIFNLSLDAKKYNEIISVYKEYAKKYLQRHGVVKVLGMQKPEKLKSVYTFVELLNAQYIRRFESIEALEQQHRIQQKATDINPPIIEKAAHKYKYLMVLGEPGAGKTTFLRKRGLEALQGKEWGLEENSKHPYIPVFIELKRLASDENIDIKKLIEEELSIFEFDWAVNFFAEGALKKGKLLVLLDGLDEVPTEKMNEVVEKIQDFVDLYDENRFIMSCRTGAYRYNFYRFADVLISYFKDEKTKEFIINWFTQKIKLQTFIESFTRDLKEKIKKDKKGNSKAIDWTVEEWEEILEKYPEYQPEYQEALNNVNDCWKWFSKIEKVEKALGDSDGQELQEIEASLNYNKISEDFWRLFFSIDNIQDAKKRKEIKNNADAKFKLILKNFDKWFDHQERYFDDGWNKKQFKPKKGIFCGDWQLGKQLEKASQDEPYKKARQNCHKALNALKDIEDDKEEYKSYKQALKKAYACWDELQKSENAAAKGLTLTPLLLTMLCLIYQREGKLPNNRASLYEKALQVLLEEWAVSKRLPQKDVYNGLDTKRLEDMLSEISYKAFQKEHSVWTRREIVDEIEEWLKREVQPKKKFINGEKVLQSIYLQHGVIVERAVNIFSFPHFTFQEYLTAQYIVKHNKLKKLVTEHFSNSYWDNVFLFLAGLMHDGADELLNAMEKEAKDCIKTRNLQELCQWADTQTHGSAGNYEQAAKRVAAVLLTRVLDCALNYDEDNQSPKLTSVENALERPLTQYIKDTFKPLDLEFLALKKNLGFQDILDYRNFIGKLDKLKIFKDVNFDNLKEKLEPLSEEAKKFEQAIVRKIFQTEFEKFRHNILLFWCDALNLEPKLVHLEHDEREALEKYARAYLLMAQCKEAAVRVSPKTWEGIKSQMLLVD